MLPDTTGCISSNLNTAISTSCKNHEPFKTVVLILPVLKTIATEKTGIHELTEAIEKKLKETSSSDKKIVLLTEKLFHLIQRKRMQDVDKQELQKLVEKNLAKGSFNLYHLAEEHSL